MVKPEEPTKDLEKLREEQEKEDGDLLDQLDREGREFDKVLPTLSDLPSTQHITNPVAGRGDRTDPLSLPRQRLRRPRPPAWRTRRRHQTHLP